MLSEYAYEQPGREKCRGVHTQLASRQLLQARGTASKPRPQAADRGSSDSDQAAGGVCGSCCFAMLRCFNTRTPCAEPDLASMLLEARAGDFLKGASGQEKVWAVPLHLIFAPLHTHTRRIDGVDMLSFVPVMGRRSRRVAFKLC